MTTTYTVGQRVRTLVDAPPAWEDAWGAPIGTLGTITGPPLAPFLSSYGVLLDDDPDQLPMSYEPHEIAPA